MALCTYFRCRDGQNYAAVVQELGGKAAGYAQLANIAINQAAGQVLNLSVFFKTTFPDPPDWLILINALTGQQIAAGNGMGHSAVILVENAGTLYLLTFGSGHSIAKKLNIEPRFGKIAVSNGKHQDEVRAVSAKVHGVAGKSRTERRGRGGPLRVLEVPRNANMASGIAAKLTLGRDHIADGNVGLRAEAPTSSNELVAYLAQLETWWNGGIETDADLAALDRIEEERDPNTLALLDAQRVADITANNANRFSLCLEDDDLWSADQIEYKVNNQRLDLGIADEAHIFGALHQASAHGNPLATRYFATHANNLETEGKLSDNLAFECQLPNNPNWYLFEERAWYRSKPAWRQSVSGDVQIVWNQTPNLTNNLILLPSANAGTEDQYTASLINDPNLGPRCIQYHRVNTGLQLELCDVLVDGRVLLFIKPGCGRSSCGDVAQQALDSAYALAESGSPLLQWANAHLTQHNLAINIAQRHSYTFCVVLLSSNPAPYPAKFTTRAMAAISSHLRDIEHLGFKAGIFVV